MRYQAANKEADHKPQPGVLPDRHPNPARGSPRSRPVGRRRGRGWGEGVAQREGRGGGEHQAEAE